MAEVSVKEDQPFIETSDGEKIPIEIRVKPETLGKETLVLQIKREGKDEWEDVLNRRVGLLPSIKFEPRNK